MLSWQKIRRKKFDQIDIIQLEGSNPYLRVIAYRYQLTLNFIDQQTLNVLIALETIHLIPFRVSKEEIYICLLWNVSFMGMWEIKLRHQSNDSSTGMILNDKHDRQFTELWMVWALDGLRGLTMELPLHIHEQSEASLSIEQLGERTRLAFPRRSSSSQGLSHLLPE